MREPHISLPAHLGTCQGLVLPSSWPSAPRVPRTGCEHPACHPVPVRGLLCVPSTHLPSPSFLYFHPHLCPLLGAAANWSGFGVFSNPKTWSKSPSELWPISNPV